MRSLRGGVHCNSAAAASFYHQRMITFEFCQQIMITYQHHYQLRIADQQYINSVIIFWTWWKTVSLSLWLNRDIFWAPGLPTKMAWEWMRAKLAILSLLIIQNRERYPRANVGKQGLKAIRVKKHDRCCTIFVVLCTYYQILCSNMEAGQAQTASM